MSGPHGRRDAPGASAGKRKRRMQVSQIEFYQFRNLENQLLAPGRGTTLIFGDNGQGKTNIIEAIWLFSCGKSFRAAADREMIRFGCDTARLKIDRKSVV